jgi:formylglycine-generating enzyme required for sulfatase activity
VQRIKQSKYLTGSVYLQIAYQSALWWRDIQEGPQHEVVIAKPFAVGRFALTFEEWDACAAHGDCDTHIYDSGWGRGRQPVIDVNWDNARSTWLGFLG